MKKTYLFVFFIYDLSFSFHFNIFLLIQNTICAHTVTGDSVDLFYYFVKPKAMAVTYIHVQGKTLWKRVVTVDYISRKRHLNDNYLFCKISRSAKLSNAL